MEPQNIEYAPQVASKLAARLGVAADRLPLLERFVEVLFFASLLPEEGASIRFGVVYAGALDWQALTPERVHGYAPWDVVDLEPVPFDPTAAAKFASLAPNKSEHLVVHHEGEQLLITGVGYQTEAPWFDSQSKILTVRVVAPGSLRFFHGDTEILAWSAGVTVLPPSWPFASEHQALADVLSAVGELSQMREPREIASVALKKLCSELIGRGHGGIIAICNSEDRELQERLDARRLRSPLRFGDLLATSWEASLIAGQTMTPTVEQSLDDERAHERVEHSLSLIGRMSTIDGAVLMLPDLSVVCFGAKLPAAGATPKVMRMANTGSLESFDMAKKGTRHRGAACFVEAGPHRIALIASADGDAAAMFKDDEGRVVYWPVRDRYGTFSL